MTVTVEIPSGRTETFDYLTSEWRDDSYCVHGWGVWDGGSLDGQSKKTFITSFETPEEALEAYPDAKPSHPLMQAQNTFDHLPDTPDY